MEAGTATRTATPIGRAAFLATACLVFLYVTARAVCVPVTHDEAMTFFIYVETGSFLPFLSHWDAGNHVLCTALAWTSFKLFGPHAWTLRLPSVLAFVVYACYAWRWGFHIREQVVRHCLWAALLLTPFLLEFFALFRGYGLAMAFWSMGLFELVAFTATRRTRHLVLLLVALALACSASLSLATLWAFALVVALGVVLWPPRISGHLVRQLALWVLVGLGCFIPAAIYLGALAAHGTLYYGLDTGILAGTVPSLLQACFGTSHPLAVVAVALIAIACAVMATIVLRRKERSFGTVALIITTGLLFADVAARVVLFRVNGTLFPEDRTALQWVPLLVLAFAFLVDDVARARPVLRWAACVFLVFPLRTLMTADLWRTSYWPQEAITADVQAAVEERSHGADPLPTIGGYHQMPPGWGFSARERGLALNALDEVDFPNAGTDLLLIDPERPDVPAGYHTLLTGRTGRVALLERDVPRMRTLVLDSVVQGAVSDAEFRELWHPAMEQVPGHAYVVEIQLAITSPAVPLVMDLITEIDADGDDRHYASMLLQFQRGAWQGDTLHVTRHFPRIATGARRTVMYFWDPGRHPYSCEGRIRVWQVEER